MPAKAPEKVVQVLNSGYIGEGEISRQFESNLATWIGNPNTAVVNSGTSALTLALRLAGVGPGTEVVSTPMTCVATNAAATSLGAKLVWADIDPLTGNIDPSSVLRALASNTKAILFVDWAGVPADLEGLNSIGRNTGVAIVQDAAHSLGALYDGVLVGNHCDFTCFSFQAIKHLTTIDGGAVVTCLPTMIERARLLRWYGLDRSNGLMTSAGTGDINEIGYKMHLNDVSAAIGIEQLVTLNSRVDTHRRNAVYLKEQLNGLQGMRFQNIDERLLPSYWVLTLLVEKPQIREQIIETFRAESIQCSTIHRRNDTYSVFEDSRVPLPGVDEFSARHLSIPCGWWLTNEDLEKIAGCVTDAVKEI